MNIFEKITDMAETAKEMASDAVDVAKLNSRIGDANKKKDRLYREIGEFYYKQFTNEEEVHPVVYAFCEEVNFVEQQIHYYEEEISKIKRRETDGAAEKPADEAVDDSQADTAAAPVAIQPVLPDKDAAEAARRAAIEEEMKSRPKVDPGMSEAMYAEQLAQQEKSRAAIQSLVLFDPFVPKLVPDKPVDIPHPPVKEEELPKHNIYPFVPKATLAEAVQPGITFQTIPLFDPFSDSEQGASGEVVIIGEVRIPEVKTSIAEASVDAEEKGVAMIVCGSCGKELRFEANFCSRCGKKLRN